MLSNRNGMFQKRIKVWDNTKKISNNYPVKESIKISDFDIEIKPKYKQTIIDVSNRDTINAAHELVAADLNPLLLNMADEYEPGGIVDSGAITQEENLFRRSNYHLTLLKKYYPLHKNEIILSPEVTVFKTDEASGYELMNNYFPIAMIASAAPRFPRLTEDATDFYYEKDKDEMLMKIRLIFKTAYKYNYDSLVLSAYGCGAFKCPPEATAKLFKQVIQEFDGCFKFVIFAILEFDKTYFVTSNYSTFRNIILE